ncbi:MAG: AraC family ligand binding domain-containing protein [Hyphomonadaceae bacterium]|nr:AraC family ligand binding domain-containing protein [Clostridia bacterium]
MSNMILSLITAFEMRLPFFLVGVGWQYEQMPINRPSGYPRFQWLQCYEGKGELIINDKRTTVRPNQGMLLFPNEAHAYHATSERWMMDWIEFDGIHLQDFFVRAGLNQSGVYTLSQPHIVMKNIRALPYLASAHDPLQSIESSKIVYTILLDLLKIYIGGKRRQSIRTICKAHGGVYVH